MQAMDPSGLAKNLGGEIMDEVEISSSRTDLMMETIRRCNDSRRTNEMPSHEK